MHYYFQTHIAQDLQYKDLKTLDFIGKLLSANWKQAPVHERNPAKERTIQRNISKKRNRLLADNSTWNTEET